MVWFWELRTDCFAVMAFYYWVLLPVGANSLSVFYKIKLGYLLNWILILEGPRKWRDNFLKQFFFQEDQLGLSLLTVEQVESEEFQKRILQSAVAWSVSQRSVWIVDSCESLGWSQSYWLDNLQLSVYPVQFRQFITKRRNREKARLKWGQ